MFHKNLIKISLIIVFFISLINETLAKTTYRQSKYLSPEYASIVMDANTGQVLESEEPDALRHPASLTKMMTLYMLFKNIKAHRLTMNTMMRVSSHAASQAPSKLGLKPGDSISVRHAILALVTKSANDVAATVAEHLGGTESAFGAQMTAQCRAMGMSKTTFVNASGLPNPHQITTARDMAILSRALYREFPQFFSHFKMKSFHYKGIEHRNHNHLLGKVVGVDGIKTGYTNASGSNLAASAVRFNEKNEPKRLIVVVLGGKNRIWRDNKVTELLESNFQRLGFAHNNHTLDHMRLTMTNLIQSARQKSKAQPLPVYEKKKDESLDYLINQVIDMPEVKKTSSGQNQRPARWTVPNRAPSARSKKKETARTTLARTTLIKTSIPKTSILKKHIPKGRKT